jgi:hypothetical protein
MARRRTKKPKPRTRSQPSTSGFPRVVRPSALLVDHEDNQLVIFTEDMLLNQLRRDGPKIEASFDLLCEKDLAELSALMSKSSSLLFSGLKVALRRRDELRIACAQLLLNGCNSIAAAVGVLRMGYVLQPGIIIRKRTGNPPARPAAATWWRLATSDAAAVLQAVKPAASAAA